MPAELAAAASIAELLGYLAVAYVVGRLLADFLADKPSGLLRVTAPLLGGSVLGLQLWLYGAAHLPWNDLAMLGPWLALAVFRWRRLLSALMADATDLAGEAALLLRSGGLEALLTVLLAVLAFAYLVNLVTQPVLGWDAIAMWMFKAKVFYLQQAVDLAPIAGDVQRNLDYPPLYPLLVDSSYVLIGHLDEVFGKSVTFLFFLTGLLGFYAMSREVLGRRLALILTFLLAALPIFQVVLFTYQQMGWADYPVGILMLVSLLHLLEGRLSGSSLSYLFAGLFAALAAMTKNEGITFLVITVLLLAAIFAVATARSVRPPIPRVLPILGLLCLVPVIAWQAYLRAHGIHGARLVSQQGVVGLLPALPARAIAILRTVRRVISLHPDYPWLGAAFFLALLLVAVRRSGPALLLGAVVVLQLGAYFAVYLITPFEIGYIVSSSLDRLVVQIAPSILIFLAVALGPHLPLDRPTAAAEPRAGQLARVGGR